jgi:hypothetical protein
MIGNRFRITAALGAAAACISACDTSPPAAAPSRPEVGGWVGQYSSPTTPAPRASTVPAGFLATDYAPLNRWLDERFEVKYRNQTPEMIFDQSPISDIRYETSQLPQGVPLFHLDSADLSRREILHRVAEFWDLDMSIEAENGTPSFVRVTGR